jgi:hypothetical protein
MSPLTAALRATSASALIGGFALASAATSTADPSADVNTLAGTMSKGYSLSNCAPQPPTSGGVLAQIACNQNPDANGPAGAQYFLLPSADALASTFKTSIHQDGINLTNCGDAQSPASWSQQGSQAGQVACATVQQQGGVAQIMWTTDAKNVMSFIRASNSDVPSLYKWWLTNG